MSTNLRRFTSTSNVSAYCTLNKVVLNDNEVENVAYIGTLVKLNYVSGM